MTDLETLLADRLETRADRVPVGPVPVDVMLRQAAVRRRRPFVVLAAAAAVAVVATAAAVVPGSDSGTAPPVAPSPSVTGEPPAGTKRVGIGHLSVEVPDAWSRDVATCGTPTEDTLLTYEVARACLVPQEKGVESVRIVAADPIGRSGVDDVVDGVAVRRGEGACEQSIDGRCQASIWVPSERVGLLVTSVGDQVAVDAIMATVRIDPGSVAVPASYRLGDGVPLAPTAYVARLRESGLVAEVSNDGGAGEQRIDSVSPDVGTVVPLGTVVRVGVVDQEPQTRP